MKGTLVEIADPRNGVSREEYEAICHTLAIKPIHTQVTDADGGKHGSVVSSDGTRTKEQP